MACGEKKISALLMEGEEKMKEPILYVHRRFRVEQGEGEGSMWI